MALGPSGGTMEGTIFTTRTPGKLIYRNNSPEAFSDKVVPGPAWRWEARKATGVGEGVQYVIISPAVS
jgi:hypothetical protein